MRQRYKSATTPRRSGAEVPQFPVDRLARSGAFSGSFGRTGTATASYTYDGDGLRASKTVSGTTSDLTWDTATSTPQLLSDGTNNYIYGPNGAPVEQLSATGTANPLYYFSDAHGSTVELTDSTGAVAATYAYTPWGAVSAHTGSSSTPILFAAAYSDAETGLLYLEARYYDPATALFLTVDPLVAASLQAYVYTDDNPLNRVDPVGLWSWKDTAIVAGMAVLAVVAVVATISIVGSEFDFAAAAGEVALGEELAADSEIASSSAQGARLAEDLAIQEGMSGEGRVIAGNGSSRGIDDINRLTNQHGGDPGDWSKMASRTPHEFPGRGAAQTHWYENVKTGCKLEGKLKWPEQN